MSSRTTGDTAVSEASMVQEWTWFPRGAAGYHAVFIVAVTMSVHHLPVAPLLFPLGLVVALILAVRFEFRGVDYLTSLLPIMFYVGIGVTTNVSAADMILPVVALITIFGTQVLRSSSRRKVVTRLFWFSGALLLVVVASTIQGQVIAASGTYIAVAGFEVAKLAICIAYAAVYAFDGLRSANSRDLRTLQVWSWTAVVLTIVSLIGLITPVWGFVPYAGIRARGSFEDPNLFAMYLLVALSLACLYNYVRYQEYFRLNAVLMVLGIASTASRSGIIALVAILCILGLFQLLLHNRVDLKLILAGMAVAASFPLWSNVAAISRVAAASELEGDKRIGLWRLAIELWRENPLVGLGYGNLQYVVQQMTGAASGQLAHNSYLTFLAETGLLGGLLFAGGISAAVIVSLRYSIVGPAGICTLMAVASIAIELIALNAHNVRFAWAAVAYLIALGVPSVGYVSKNYTKQR